MAGKAKKKLDYAGWSVDIFDNDTKIDKLLDAQGWVGFSIYFYLCQRAFGSEGYFYRWSYDDCASTARKMGCGIGSGTVSETVGYCLQIDLFNKAVFDRWGVLTSRGIQRSFWAVASERRDKTVYQEIWLLQKEECKGVVFVPFFSDMSAANGHLQDTNSDMSATNDTVVKESKGKESKGKESRVKNTCAQPEKPPDAQEIIAFPLNDKTEYPIYDTDFEEWKELYPAVDIMQELRKMKGWLDSNPTKRKTIRGIRRFINSWLSKAQDRPHIDRAKNRQDKIRDRVNEVDNW